MDRGKLKLIKTVKGSLYALNRYRLPYLFLLPTIVILSVLLIAPIFSGIYMSFQKTSLRGTTEFVQFQNYRFLFNESRFINNVTRSLLYVIGNLSLSLPLAYTAALLVTRKLESMRFFRAIFLLPWIIAPVVSAVLFKSLVDPSFGPLTLLLGKITGSNPVILADSNLALLTVIGHSFWRSFPFMMLFLAAGIVTIPPEFYEAAKVDGAGPWTQFRYVTLPLTRIHLAIVLLIITMWTVQDAETIYALTQGGPGYGTEVTAVRLFKESFVNFDLNTGATIGVVLIVVSVIFMAIYLKLVGRTEYLQ
ncbi:MAG: carbohydrate ABC transporter permease [Candidatus Bipolaricaulia bacterium]